MIGPDSPSDTGEFVGERDCVEVDDNAMCESFFATLECEPLDRTRFKTQTEARMAVFDFIEGSYNPRRRHSTLGQISRLNFERSHGVAA